jgi:hypothetical protein
MADDQHDYKVGPGRPPLHTRFRKGQSGNRCGRSKKRLNALLEPKYNENLVFCVNGMSNGQNSQRCFNRLRVKFVTWRNN